MNKIYYALFLLVALYSHGQSDGCPSTNTLTPGSSCVPAAYSMPGSFANGGLTSSSCISSNRDDGWYRFTATAALTEITVTASGADAVLALYQGTVCAAANGSQLTCTNVPAGASGTITFATTIGQTYLIQIHRNSGTNTTNLSGTICLFNIIPPPPNDDCVNAIPLVVQSSPSTCAGNLAVTNLAGATPSIDPNLCGGVTNDDVWFTFVATSSAVGIGVQEGGSVNSYHSLYTNTCGSLTLVSCSDPNVSNVYGLTPGTTYYVRVYTIGGAPPPNPGFIGVCVWETPPAPTNDDCASAIPLTPSSGGLCGGSPLTASTSPSISPLPACQSGFGEDDVWFSFVAQQDTHFLDITGSPMHTEVFEGTCGTLNLLFCRTRFLIGLTPGSTYFVRVYGSGYAPGVSIPFNICITSPPPCNPYLPPPADDCGNATLLNSFSGYCGTTLSSYTVDQFPEFCFGEASGGANATVENNSWLAFDAIDDTVEITYWVSSPESAACPIGIQYTLFSGVCGALVNVPGTCGTADGSGTASTGGYGNLTFTGLTLGERYYIMIDGYSGDVCDYVWQGVSGIAIMLSVQWGDVSAKWSDSQVVVEWQTLSETNNAHFEIERYDEENALWGKIGTLQGQGTVTSTQDYRFVDVSPNMGYNYYRIAQHDFDGKLSYSMIASAQLKEDEIFFQVAPNPAKNRLFVNTSQKIVGMTIVNQLGRPLPFVSQEMKIIEIDYPAGLYFMQVEFANGNHHHKSFVVE
jgi:hypothetical protein